MKLYLRLFKESVLFALNALRVNKLRTFLSLLGITIGIFSIISVFTLVDTLENNVRNSVEDLGNKVIFVQKWPWQFGGDYHWWDYMNRPHPKWQEQRIISERSELAEGSAFVVDFNRTVKYKNNSVENIVIEAASGEYNKVRNFTIEKGRYFSEAEFRNGKPICIIGALTAYDLFGPISPIGKTIKIGGMKANVVGVFKKEGESMIGFSMDEQVLIPINFARTIMNVNARQLNPMIMVKAKENVSNKELKDELIGIMRSARHLKPKEDQNFALNEISIISEGFNGFFGVINIIGWIIGAFSLIVGGFSIANIMFVSVKERINIIGIQKSLGAKNLFILFQFLSESVVLCLLGGGIGLLIIFIGTIALTHLADMEVFLSFGNMFLGVGISVFIGLLSGIIPAWSAAKLDPVIAIRAKG